MSPVSDPNEMAPSGHQPTVTSSGPSSSSSSSSSNFVLCDQHRTESGYPIPSELLANGTSRDEVKSHISSLSVRESPLFDRKTTLSDPYWTQQRYDDLRPAFQLATILITHESQLSFWHGIICTAKEYIKRGVPKEPEIQTSETDLTESEEEYVLSFLNKVLAGRVIIRAADVASSEEANTAAFEFDSEKQKEALFPNAPLSSGTYINFGADGDYYACITVEREMVDEACAWHKPGRTVEETRLRYLRLATTIVHELVHAACEFLLKRPLNLSDDPYFEGEYAAEIGFAWEKFFWGGILRSSNDDQRLFLDRWPGEKVFWQYANDDDLRTMETRDGDPGRLDKRRPHYVPDEEWVRLFSETYWSGYTESFSECCPILDADESIQGGDSSTSSEDRGASVSNSEASQEHASHGDAAFSDEAGAANLSAKEAPAKG